MKHQVSTVASRAGALVAGAAVAAGLLVASGAAQAAKPTNAQSLSFTLSSPQNFILTSEEFWAYDQTAAREFFTNGVFSGPTVSCTGGGPGGVNCQPGNQPDAPDAPAPDPNRVNAPVNNNQCVFWEGGNLTVQTGNRDYMNFLSRPGKNGAGNWRFTWTYNVGVVAGVNPVAQMTAWVLESESPADGVPIAVSGSLAGQSTQLMTGRNARFKTSHTLIDGFGAPRLNNAGIRLTKLGAPNVDLGTIELGLPGFPNYSVLQNVDFFYLANAGTFNFPPGLLVPEQSNPDGTPRGAFVSDIQNGLVVATDGQTRDNFPGNDGQGGDLIVFGAEDPQNGEPLVLGVIDEPGSYKVTLFGELKGNPGEIDAGFEGTADIRVNSACVAP